MRPTLILAAVLVVGACFLLDPTVDEPGLIIFYEFPSVFTAADSAAPGESITVMIRTFGGGCTREIAHTFVDVKGLVAEIRPYNETKRGCAPDDDLLFLDHRVTIAFNEPGVATIRAVGERRTAVGAASSQAPAQLTRQVVIH